MKTYTPQWQNYEFTFISDNPQNAPARGPLFALGTAKGTLFLKDVELTVSR